MRKLIFWIFVIIGFIIGIWWIASRTPATDEPIVPRETTTQYEGPVRVLPECILDGSCTDGK